MTLVAMFVTVPQNFIFLIVTEGFWEESAEENI
jgi:hypothetical protein